MYLTVYIAYWAGSHDSTGDYDFAAALLDSPHGLGDIGPNRAVSESEWYVPGTDPEDWSHD